MERDYPMPLAGVDEAGCAPLAGPVVAAAVILDRDHFPRGIDDSKQLPAPTREAICARLKKVAIWGVGIACGLAMGLDLAESIRRARLYVQLAIRAAPGFGRGHGPMGHALGTVPWNLIHNIVE